PAGRHDPASRRRAAAGGRRAPRRNDARRPQGPRPPRLQGPPSAPSAVMMSREPTPPIHDALVARLMADARPVRRLWTPRRRLGLWVAVAVAVLGIAAGVGLRDDLAVQLFRARYLLELALLVGAAV